MALYGDDDDKKDINPSKNISITGDTLPDFIKKRYEIKDSDTTYYYAVYEDNLPKHKNKKEYEDVRVWMDNWIKNRPKQWENFARTGYKNTKGHQPEEVDISWLDKLWVGDNILPEDKEIIDYKQKQQVAGKDLIKESSKINVLDNIGSLSFMNHGAVHEWDKQYNKKENKKPLYGDYNADGVYKPYGHFAYFPYEKKNKVARPGTVAHEVGHGTHLTDLRIGDVNNRSFPASDIINEIRNTDEKYTKGAEEWTNYEKDIDETYSRIWDLRKTFDVKPSDIITEKQVARWRKNNSDNAAYQLFDMYNNSTIVRMMNELVEAKPKENNLFTGTT